MNDAQEEEDRIHDMKLFPDSDKDAPPRVNTVGGLASLSPPSIRERGGRSWSIYILEEKE